MGTLSTLIWRIHQFSVSGCGRDSRSVTPRRRWRQVGTVAGRASRHTSGFLQALRRAAGGRGTMRSDAGAERPPLMPCWRVASDAQPRGHPRRRLAPCRALGAGGAVKVRGAERRRTGRLPRAAAFAARRGIERRDADRARRCAHPGGGGRNGGGTTGRPERLFCPLSVWQ